MKLKDINYNYLAFRKDLNEFKGIFGNYKNLGENIWIDSNNGDILGNSDIKDYIEIIFKEDNSAFLIINFMTDYCWGDLEIVLGIPEEDYKHDGYFHNWYYDSEEKRWNERGSDYYNKHALVNSIETESNPLMILNFDLKDMDKVMTEIKQKVRKAEKEIPQEKLFYWD